MQTVTATSTDTSSPTITGTGSTTVEAAPTTVFAVVECDTLYVIGDAVSDAVTLRLDTTAGEYDVLITQDGTAPPSTDTFATSSFSSVVVLGETGDFALTIDNENGDPVPTGGISFTGGSGTNTLVGPNQATANQWDITLRHGASIAR